VPPWAGPHDASDASDASDAPDAHDSPDTVELPRVPGAVRTDVASPAPADGADR